jgi:hypothetical protein
MLWNAPGPTLSREEWLQGFEHTSLNERPDLHTSYSSMCENPRRQDRPMALEQEGGLRVPVENLGIFVPDEMNRARVI